MRYPHLLLNAALLMALASLSPLALSSDTCANFRPVPDNAGHLMCPTIADLGSFIGAMTIQSDTNQPLECHYSKDVCTYMPYKPVLNAGKWEKQGFGIYTCELQGKVASPEECPFS